MKRSYSGRLAIYLLSIVALVCVSTQFGIAEEKTLQITTVAGTGTPGFGGDGGAATSAQISRPREIAIDADGNLYLTDSGNNRIRKISPSGIITTIAGTGNEGFSGDGSAASSASIYRPYGIAVDNHGNIFFVDGGNIRVRKINKSGIISTVAGNGEYGFSGDGGPALSAQLGKPYAVAVDSKGNLYISELDNRRIRKVDKSGKIRTIVGNGTASLSGDDGPATSATIANVTGIAVDKSGNIYFADSLTDRIRKISTKGIITTVAGGGSANPGDGGLATSAKLDAPIAVAIDSLGQIYFSEVNRNRVRKIDNLGIITTVAGDGTLGYNGDNINAKSAKLSTPQGIAVDSKGNLYIVDSTNQRIRKVY